ncbi:MAG: glycosyltransferase family 2 protein [Actinobacteria bacterium]|nr:glycosyltransferase family 2 protein [Actinomycetota bacterium]
MPPELPSFDLVVATVGRVEELSRLLASLESQSHRDLRVILVDQNTDDRLERVLANTPLDILRVPSELGLSRARNAGLEHVAADIVAFPDDDCAYPEDLLRRVAVRLAGEPDVDGLTGRAASKTGRSSTSWKPDRATLTDANLWNRAISFTIFLRRGVVERVGAFDERLGLGSPEQWSSGEEIDYLIRAVRAGAQIEYDPSLVVEHEVGRDDTRVGRRDGASVGYLLRKHAYPARTVVRMLVRPTGGAIASLVRRDPVRARFHMATLRGRLDGYRKATQA